MVRTGFLLFQFFLMERAGRRRLLLAGFISVATCNLLLTTLDSVLVSWSCCHHGPVSSKAWLMAVSRCPAAPGSRAARPAGAAGLLPGLSLRAGPRAHLLVHRSRAV